MAFKIEYSQDFAYRYPKQKETHKWNLGKLWVVLVLLAVLSWFRVSGVPDFLVPGDPAVTRSAAADFLENVETGMKVGEAVTVFCEQIIDGAGT